MDPDMTVRQLPLHRQGFPDSYAVKSDGTGAADQHSLSNSHILSNMLHSTPQANLLASMAGGYGMNFAFSPAHGAETFGNGLFPQLQGLPQITQGTDAQRRPVGETSATASSTG